jgi:hypothetical protein
MTRKPAKPRNAIAVAMRKRHGHTTTIMRDRRAPRRGAINKVRAYIAGDY